MPPGISEDTAIVALLVISRMRERQFGGLHSEHAGMLKQMLIEGHEPDAAAED